MPITLRFCISLMLIVNFPSQADTTADFGALLDEAWEWQLTNNPVFASSLGDRRFNDQWTDNALEAIEQRQQQQRAFLDRVIAIDSSQLSDSDRLNYDLFRRQFRNSVDGQQYKEYLMPMSQRGGKHRVIRGAARRGLGMAAYE